MIERNTNTNFVAGRSSVTESDKKALDKAHKYEKQMMREGYRWIKINHRLSLFVECDKDGNPTEFGRKQIERQKDRFELKY